MEARKYKKIMKDEYEIRRFAVEYNIPVIINMPLYPIQTIHDADDFAFWFIDKLSCGLGVDEIRFLEKIR